MICEAGSPPVSEGSRSMPRSSFSVKPVTKAVWPDLEALFEAKGGPKYCWCMAWRPMEDRTTADNAARKQALYDRVRRRVPIGLIGYVDGVPVGWCSAGPRATFLRLRDDQDDGEEGVWSVTCFFVRRDHRQTGVSGRLLDAAIALARKRGAKALEGYPVDPDSPSYRFMGFVKLFEERGFAHVGRAGTRRHVMRLAL
jgi:GNAT superfamily N-acetyltransferase